MHGCGVIICMKTRDFSAKLVNPGIMLNSQDQEKNISEPNSAKGGWIWRSPMGFGPVGGEMRPAGGLLGLATRSTPD